MVRISQVESRLLGITVIPDIPFFNRLASSQELMISADCWRDVHPLLATIPIDRDFVMPYGLIYSKELSRELLQFIMAIANIPDQQGRPAAQKLPVCLRLFTFARPPAGPFRRTFSAFPGCRCSSGHSY